MRSRRYHLHLSTARSSRSRRSSWAPSGCRTVEICSSCKTRLQMRSRWTHPSTLQHPAHAPSFAMRTSPVRACLQVPCCTKPLHSCTPTGARARTHRRVRARPLPRPRPRPDTHTRSRAHVYARNPPSSPLASVGVHSCALQVLWHGAGWSPTCFPRGYRCTADTTTHLKPSPATADP
jgi:hypothetical protein